MSSGTTESTGFYDLLAWLEANKNRLMIGAVALTVVGFGVAFVRWQGQQTELEASDTLLKLRAPLGTFDETKGPKAEDYLAVAKEYPGTSAAARAELLGAGALFADGKYAEAAAEFERFESAHSSHPLAATAAHGVAASLDAQGKRGEAVNAYQNVLTRYPNTPFGDDVKLAMARIHEADGQNEKAFKLYEELSKSTSSSKSMEALSRKDRLASKFPELAKTIIPAATSTNTAPSISTISAPSADATAGSAVEK